jgi:hypothetical protein
MASACLNVYNELFVLLMRAWTLQFLLSCSSRYSTDMSTTSTKKTMLYAKCKLLYNQY